MDRVDEIGTLATEFDNMTDKLIEARRKLVDQSFNSGMAELSSGILHNVRNSLTPVTIEIEKLKQDIQSVPLDQIEMARSELKDGNISPERIDDLNKFIDISGQTLAEIHIDTNQAVTQAIMKKILAMNLRLAEPGEFT